MRVMESSQMNKRNGISIRILREINKNIINWDCKKYDVFKFMIS